MINSLIIIIAIDKFDSFFRKFSIYKIISFYNGKKIFDDEIKIK